MAPVCLRDVLRDRDIDAIDSMPYFTGNGLITELSALALICTFAPSLAHPAVNCWRSMYWASWNTTGSPPPRSAWWTARSNVACTGTWATATTGRLSGTRSVPPISFFLPWKVPHTRISAFRSSEVRPGIRETGLLLLARAANRQAHCPCQELWDPRSNASCAALGIVRVNV
jgi:hypothetical protein